ncbi:uroporphyrinogen-III synthase [Gymnodinialimonas ceratoperidinii]|uniref:Uroporphyrinogen-III synthase n=1 Tax=Gymnodinialimonas ceratoperidinii TaxID=2856823 RepID=A0A8F6YBI6_9RHOB|nr:uroporphyrinogen-III synthase [Gymnodinialimonas ceratoperidinii]QXT40146.1 uroporphyrinogen-III synthase [Gymnodinialimonas ceratoperidinii]
MTCEVTLRVMQVHQTPTLLLTRPRPASERFARGLTGVEIVIAPLMEIVGTGARVELNGVDGLILTSEAAVGFLPPSTLPAYCVGPRTATAARAAGLQAEVAGLTADELVENLTARPPHDRLLHVHGTQTRGDVAARLANAGLSVAEVAAYDQRRLPPSEVFSEALTRPHLIVPLFSPRSASIFAEAAPSLRADTRLVALSDAVADALPPEMRRQTRVASMPTGKDMRIALELLGVELVSP